MSGRDYGVIELPHDGGFSLLRHAIAYAEEKASTSKDSSGQHASDIFTKEFEELASVYGVDTMLGVLDEYRQTVGLPLALERAMRTGLLARGDIEPIEQEGNTPSREDMRAVLEALKAQIEQSRGS